MYCARVPYDWGASCNIKNNAGQGHIEYYKRIGDAKWNFASIFLEHQQGHWLKVQLENGAL